MADGFADGFSHGSTEFPTTQLVTHRLGGDLPLCPRERFCSNLWLGRLQVSFLAYVPHVGGMCGYGQYGSSPSRVITTKLRVTLLLVAYRLMQLGLHCLGMDHPEHRWASCGTPTVFVLDRIFQNFTNHMGIKQPLVNSALQEPVD